MPGVCFPWAWRYRKTPLHVSIHPPQSLPLVPGLGSPGVTGSSYTYFEIRYSHYNDFSVSSAVLHLTFWLSATREDRIWGYLSTVIVMKMTWSCWTIRRGTLLLETMISRLRVFAGNVVLSVCFFPARYFSAFMMINLTGNRFNFHLFDNPGCDFVSPLSLLLYPPPDCMGVPSGVYEFGKRCIFSG